MNTALAESEIANSAFPYETMMMEKNGTLLITFWVLRSHTLLVAKIEGNSWGVATLILEPGVELGELDADKQIAVLKFMSGHRGIAIHLPRWGLMDNGAVQLRVQLVENAVVEELMSAGREADELLVLSGKTD